MNKITSIILITSAAALSTASVFSDNFDGNTNVNLGTQTFSTGATTSFTHWPIGTSGDMGEGYFSVVNKAKDVHSQFVEKLDADNNANGNYAIFNAFNNSTATAYSITLNALTVGQMYSFSAAVLPLAPNPPYAQSTELQFALDGNGLGANYTLLPVPLGTEQWVVVSRSFVATSTSHTLSIGNVAGGSLSGNDYGIDNVAVEAVPEPATMTVLALGAAAMLRRRRK